MAWFKSTPSDEALEAVASSNASRKRALSDLEKAKGKLEESRPVISAIREHNEANHYDDFLRSLTQG